MGRIRTGLSGIGKGRERFACARKHMVKRQKLTDQTRGADRNIAVFGTYKRRDLLRSAGCGCWSVHFESFLRGSRAVDAQDCGRRSCESRHP